LEQIAGLASVTRGAIYWHFEDKKALYRAVVDYTLENADIAEYASQLPTELPLEERVDRVFWHALEHNRFVDFVYKTINYSWDNEESEDVQVKLRNAKQHLLRIFDEEIELYMRIHQVNLKEPSDYSVSLFLLFEGMFLAKHVSIEVSLDREHIQRYIHLVLSDLLEAN
ncbi:MAG: TetR family transcriptional regulator, partial [Oscillospiraceae bacterium]